MYTFLNASLCRAHFLWKRRRDIFRTLKLLVKFKQKKNCVRWWYRFFFCSLIWVRSFSHSLSILCIHSICSISKFSLRSHFRIFVSVSLTKKGPIHAKLPIFNFVVTKVSETLTAIVNNVHRRQMRFLYLRFIKFNVNDWKMHFEKTRNLPSICLRLSRWSLRFFFQFKL